MTLKFTQAVKDNWIDNLESGKYTQGFGSLVDGNGNHCCIGVLGACTPELNNHLEDEETSPYKFLKNNLGNDVVVTLYDMNDNALTRPANRDYSNVIDFIKSLPVVDE